MNAYNNVAKKDVGNKLDTYWARNKWFAEHGKHYPSRSGQTSLATAVTNFTQPTSLAPFLVI